MGGAVYPKEGVGHWVGGAVYLTGGRALGGWSSLPDRGVGHWVGGAVYLTGVSGTEWVEQFTRQRGSGTEWVEQFI